MTPHLRDYRPADRDAVVELALDAWSPVFASMRAVLGLEIDARLHGEDWRVYQAKSVRETLAAEGIRAWVAERDGRIVGFVVATVADAERRIGEIAMIAVAPAAQRQGTGRALTEHATAWLREIGMAVVAIGTGGDPGHEPARRLYERAGYRLMPAAQYFRAV